MEQIAFELRIPLTRMPQVRRKAAEHFVKDGNDQFGRPRKNIRLRFAPVDSVGLELKSLAHKGVEGLVIHLTMLHSLGDDFRKVRPNIGKTGQEFTNVAESRQHAAAMRCRFVEPCMRSSDDRHMDANHAQQPNSQRRKAPRL